MRFCWIYLLFLCTGVYSQTTDSVSFMFEKETGHKFEMALAGDSGSIKLEIMNNIEKELAAYLKNGNSYIYPFDSLKRIGKVYSPDNQFRMFTWNVQATNESFLNFCIIQFNPQKEKTCEVYVLKDNLEIDKAGDTPLTPANWYGALYYKIIPVKLQGEIYYTLLGYDSFSPYVSKKVIDVLYFKNRLPQIGAPIFNAKGKKYSRVVFSFSARITMMLNYDDVLKTIVFDHLSPSEPRYAGQFEYYGPDFSFDGFVLTKDHWLYAEDIKPNRPAPKDKNAPRKGSNKLSRK